MIVRKTLPHLMLAFAISSGMTHTASASGTSDCVGYHNPVPFHVSDEAKDFISRLPDPATYPAFPEARDLEAWRQLNALQEQRSAQVGLVTVLRRSPERFKLATGDRRDDQAFRRV